MRARDDAPVTAAQHYKNHRLEMILTRLTAVAERSVSPETTAASLRQGTRRFRKWNVSFEAFIRFPRFNVTKQHNHPLPELFSTFSQLILLFAKCKNLLPVL
jgi:hypothetical protein